jgi:uncharacterized protein YutE (UPF0331/DUF86 family)
MNAQNDVLLERLRLLNEYVSDLRDLQGLEFEAYTENKLVRRAVERTLHLAIEACLDVGQHFIAQEGFRVPEDNKSVFIVLSEEEILPSHLLPRLINMAKFRNLIVHDYASIDNHVVFEILKGHLHDFEAFARVIVRYIESD